MLCFSDREPPGYGPRRIAEREIRESFAEGWSINYIRPVDLREPHPGRRAPCLALIDNKKMMDGFSAVRLKAATKPTYFLWKTTEICFNSWCPAEGHKNLL